METDNTNQQIPPQAPLPNPSSLSKTFIIILGAMLVLIIGIGSYILGTRKNQIAIQNQQPTSSPTVPQPSPTIGLNFESTSSAKTANWKTYISEDNTFSFKYPPEWIYETKKTTLEVREKKYNATYIEAGIPLTEKDLKLQQEYWGRKDVDKTYSQFSLLYATSPEFKDLTLENLVEELIGMRAIIDYRKDKLLNDNISAIEVGYGCQAYCIDILFKNGNAVFDSSTGPNPNDIQQILDTFKFTP